MALTQFLRPVRSYVLRQGRMTSRQQQALENHWSTYGLEVPTQKTPYDWDQVFGRSAPVVLEIGFGMGDTLIGMAKAYPEINFIGIEVHRPGVGNCLFNAHELGIKNLRVMVEDAKHALSMGFSEQTIDKVMLLFPDPWPKARHHKRRLVQNDFVTAVAGILKTGGCFHMATDWEPYADHMLSVLSQCPAFTSHPISQDRLVTKYERRGQRLGHAIQDLVYQRQ